jgi:transposase
LLPLFRCIYQKILEKSLLDKHWHADETGWKVFEALEGKASNRWFLWIFRSNSTAVFLLDPSRSAKVVEGFFGKDSKGIISCDRYRAYFCFVSKSHERFLIAYCWVHVRRDFLAIAKDWPAHEAWGMDWVQEIRHLYHLNNLRIAEKKGSQKFLECHRNLNEAVLRFKEKADKQREDTALSEPCKKALESLARHWQGLITFLEHSEVPMDNNAAERGLRGGAVGRKNYYGSGSVESAEFTAIMFTIIQTLLIWGVNPQAWFDSFFNFIGSDGSV